MRRESLGICLKRNMIIRCEHAIEAATRSAAVRCSEMQFDLCPDCAKAKARIVQYQSIYGVDSVSSRFSGWQARNNCLTTH